MVAFAVACAPALPSRQAQHLGSLRASRRIAAPAGAPAGLAPRRRQVPAGGQSRPAVSQSRPTLPQAISRDFGPELSFDDFDFPKAIDDSPYGDPYVSFDQCLPAGRFSAARVVVVGGASPPALACTAAGWRCYQACCATLLALPAFMPSLQAGPLLCHCGLGEERACGAAGAPHAWF